MTRIRFILGLGAMVAAALPLGAAEEVLPKAETILDRYVEVTGGKAAYEKLKSEAVTMNMEFVGKGIKGTGARHANSANNSRETVELDGIGKLESGVQNGVAWEMNPVTGSRLLQGDEKADRLRDSYFNGPLHWRKLWKSAETAGIENVEGEDCYKVVLTPAEGKPETDYFSKKTGLLLKKARVVTSPMGEMQVEIYASAYKPFAGVSVPTRVSQKMMGNEIVITVAEVKLNSEIPAGTFEPPAEIRKLMAK
jgi:hypothetical protein